MTEKAILVMGSSGKTGREVARRLTTSDRSVRLGSRSGEPPFDWQRPATWAAALHGVESIYLVYSPHIDNPSAPAAVHAFAELAVACGVRRVVMLSSRGRDESTPTERTVRSAEQAIRDSGLGWTILRPSWFFQNFSEVAFLLDPVCEGEVRLPTGDGLEGFVDVGDIADVAVAALTDNQHVGRLYELSGPRLLTFREAVAEIGTATGREIRYVPLSVAEYAEHLTARKTPAGLVALVTELFSRVRSGEVGYLSDGVQRVLKREPRDFADYAKAIAATGVWTS